MGPLADAAITGAGHRELPSCRFQLWRYGDIMATKEAPGGALVCTSAKGPELLLTVSTRVNNMYPHSICRGWQVWR